MRSFFSGLALSFTGRFWIALVLGLREIWRAILTILRRIACGERRPPQPNRTGCCIDLPPEVYKRGRSAHLLAILLDAARAGRRLGHPDIDIFDDATLVTGPLRPNHRMKVNIVKNNISLASALVLSAFMTGILVLSGSAFGSQDAPGVNKISLQVTARTLNFYGKNRNMWSWVPEFRFSLTRDRNSGDQHYVEYTIPGGAALKFDCELNSKGDGFKCGGRNIPEDKGSIYTGPVNFAIKMRNELQGAGVTLFTGRMKVAKACTNPSCPPTAGEWVYYVDNDWNLPIGHIFYDMDEPEYPTFNVAFWLRGDTHRTEPHLFYQGKEIGVTLVDGTQIGKASCRAIVENEPTHKPNDTIGGAKWTRMECYFPMVKGWDNKGENQNDVFKMAANLGEYEFKLLWNNKLARSIKFTVGANGKLDNGIASANKLGTGRVIVPVTIIGDQDGQWDRAAWKTEAFYGNPLTGFTAPQ